MSLILDMVVGKVKNAPPAEFREFAEALAGSLSSVQVAIVKEVLRREEERRERISHLPTPITQDPFNIKRWGI